MNKSNERPHPIRFSFNYNRLSISMDVLRTVGNPAYVQIFISSDRKTLYIKGCDTKESESFMVPPRVYADTEYKYSLRKAAFSEAICCAQGWDRNSRYRLYGVLVSERVMGFSFDDAVRLDNREES
jgi:hypothetical protein